MIDTVFLDRDGVINRKRPEGDYVKSWDEFEFLPGAVEAVALLKRAGLRLVIITNQRGIARGVMTLEDLADIHRRMLAAFAEAGAEIDGIYYCPHEKGMCDCRKPKPGMLRQAQQDCPQIIAERSIIVGDSLADLETGLAMGFKTLLIAEGPRKARLIEQARDRDIRIDDTAPSLLDAAHGIISRLNHPLSC